ncbi:FxSxx-COOH system tetratricopeptide repeat protein [Streptomyces griseosporeus]|uniref:FxSxx-COOH system tetratricopeptide repeat protein n=1 Tax=Streptomyces griseosporeus TaxID=1910 RepID=UPI0036F7D23A
MAAELGHVTVVFAGQSESWAKWIDHQIRAVGRGTTLVRWNPLRRPPTAEAFTELLGAPGRVLLVIDDWHERLGSERFEAWAAALRRVLPVYQDRIAAVSITARPMPAAAIPLAPVELRGLRPEVARGRVLECAGIAAPGTLIDLRRGPRFPDDPPDVWQVPRRNRRFIGRTELLEKVYGAFSAAGTDGAAVALLGPGGFGKTQLALEYVHRFAGEYDIVWWVNAAQRVTARQQFADLAPALDLRDAGDLAATITAVRRELDRTVRPWLLVLDGAGDPDRLVDLLPEGRGHVLVTTHRSEWGAHAENIAVPAFERGESVAFLERRTERLDDGQAARLAEAVEDMPLLLDQTAAWLDINPTVPVDDYIRDIRDGRPDRFGVMPSGHYPESFEVAWAKLVNTLREGSESAWQLLNLLVCFSHDVVPIRLLQSARHGDLPPELAELIAEPSSWNTALRRLSEITSMRIEYEPGPRLDTQTVGTLRMHRLFHRFVRSIQSPADAARYSAAARKVLVSADPRDSSSAGNWARYAALIPHLEPSGALDSIDDDARELVLNCIEYLRMRGEYHDGWWLSREAVERWRVTSGDTDRSVLVAVHQLANMLRRLGRYEEAEAVGRQILGRLTRHADSVRPIEVIRAKDGLGGTLMALGRYDEARALFEEAAATAAAELGGEHVPRTLAIRSNLAVALGLQGHYAASLALHRSVFEARVEVLGGRDALTLNSALRTAWMLRLLGNYREALAIQGHNSRVHSQVLDRTHSQTLLAEHNLALCARRVGDLQFAHAMLRGVREKLIRRRGPLHPETLMVSCDYAMLLREMGQTGEARDLAEATATHYAAQLGDRHPYAIGARDNVATILRDLGEHRAALELSRRTARQMRKAVGRDHPWTLGCAKNEVAALAAVGDVAAAAAVGRETAERSARVLGDTHILTISLRAGLALDLAELGEREEAEALHEDTVTRLTALLGADHPHTRSILQRHRPYWDFEPQPI